MLATLAVSPAPPYAIETQVAYGAANLDGSTMQCRPDIRIITQRERILVEHKIEASQHIEAVAGHAEGYSQLERYLAADPKARVGLVTLGPTDVRPGVLENSRYLRPSGRTHFVWHDLFPAVETYAQQGGADDPFVIELVAFMEELGMQTPREGVGIIPAANVEGIKAERRALSLWWRPTLDLALEQGWIKTHSGLDLLLRRKRGEYPEIHFDMRAREKQGKTDGFLKARLRVDADAADGADELARELRRAGYDATVGRARGANGPCVDVVCLTRQTRTEYIGEGDPTERLTRFGCDAMQAFHHFLDLPPFSAAKKTALGI